MTSGYEIKVFYRDDRKPETHYVDDYEVKNGCLCYFIRFGVNSGKHCIPLDIIKEFIIDR